MVQCDKTRDTLATKPIGDIVQTVLSMAKCAQRITLGFSDAIKSLSNTPEEAQFCFLAEPSRGDSATHMHEVLLQAFCYEHGIYIIKVDSGQKLAHILDSLNEDEKCVLIRKPGTKRVDKMSATTEAATQQTTAAFNSIEEEDILVNFCENSWHNSDYRIVKLPES